METLNVLVTMPFEASLIEKLKATSPDIRVTQREARQVEDIADLIEETDVLYTWQALPLPEQAPRLRWVQLHLAGVDSILEHPLYTKLAVIFTNLSGIHAVPTAEYAMAQILAFAHRLPTMLEDKASATWTDKRWLRYVPNELYGATLGIVGYGSIARRLARLGRAFGMHVLVVKRDVRQLALARFSLPDVGDPEGELPDRIYPPKALHSFLAECDYVVILVPLTPQTRGMIDHAALASMKQTAVLVNVARGEVVDEAALIEALQSNTIAGAALDVFSQEPLPADSPLWKLPNVIISPHVAGFTPHYDARATDLFAENIRRFLADEPLLNVVDRSLNY